MKKYTLFLFVLLFSFGLFITNVNLVEATDGTVSAATAIGCQPGDLFSRTTGQFCSDTSAVVICPAGDLFSSVTGQPCDGKQPDNSSSIVAQFNALFKSNFKIGLRGSSDVKALQQFLKDQGYFFGKIDGSYGKVSVRAVKDFQDDNDVTTPTTTSAPTMSISATSTSIISGQSTTITWSSTNATSCINTGSGGLPAPLGTSGSVIVTPIISTEYMITCTGPGGSATQSVTVTVTAPTTSTCSSGGFDSTTGLRCGCTSTSSYSSYDGQSCGNSTTPVISGVSGPQTLNVNQTGTWTVTAYDKNGGSLSYEVVWGDEVLQLYTSNQSVKMPTQQSATFTHSYSQVGKYTPTFTVRNSSGYLAQTSLSVNVGGVTTSLSCSALQQTQQSFFNVCKDGGFEKVCFNKDGVFQGCSLDSVDTCTVNNMNASTNISCSVGLTQPVIIASASTGGTISPSGNIAVSTGSNKTFTLTPNSGYKVDHITIDNSYDLPATLSYTFYNITQSHIIGAIFGSVSTQPSITVLSPNGGEIWQVGTTQTIRWNVGSDSSIKYVNFELRTIVSAGTAGVTGRDLYLQAPNTGSLTFTLPSSYPAGTYFLQIKKTDETLLDESDSYFTITSATTTTGTLSFSQDSFNFNYTQGGNTPAVQSLTFTNTSNTSITYTSSVPNQPSWLSTALSTWVSLTLVPNMHATEGISINLAGLTPGIYTTNIIITGNFTGSPKTISVTLTVTAPTTTPSITVLSPNGGETYKVGDAINIQWNAQNFPTDKVAFINLVRDTNPGLFVDNISQGYCNLKGGCIPISQNSYRYVIPQTVTSGSYKIVISCWDRNSEGSSCGEEKASSNSSFTITAATSTLAISTTSLSSGTVGVAYTSSLQTGASGLYTWSATGLPAGLILTNNIISGTPTTAGMYTVTVTLTLTSGTQSVPKQFSLVIANVLGAESFYFTQFLEQGSHGNEVMELQKFLNGAGYDCGTADGVFGLKVKAAVSKFQTDNGLKVDGIVGFEVRTFLNK